MNSGQITRPRIFPGLFSWKRAIGKQTLKKELSKITLYEVYKTVTNDDDQVLKFYDMPTDASIFEKSIQRVAYESFSKYIESFYTELKSHTVMDIYNQL